MRRVTTHWFAILASSALVGLAGCADDDDTNVTPTGTGVGTGGSGGSAGSGGVGGSGGSELSERFLVRIDNVASFTNQKSGAYDTPVGAGSPGVLAPGEAYEVTFTAGPHHSLVFATMFVQSNDWFFAPDAAGIPLFDQDDHPISGDITDQVKLWDAGTEIDEEPGVGQHTAPNQGSSTDGPGADDPNDLVREVPKLVTLTDGSMFTRPDVNEMIEVSITSDEATREFTLRIENVATDDGTLLTSDGYKPVRLSPGVWALGLGSEPIFTAGDPDRGEGLEEIAEGGDPTNLDAALAMHSGVATPLSPGVWVVHTAGMPIFESGQPDRGLGLENIAETGDISVLAGSFMSELPMSALDYGTYAVPVGANDPGPIFPQGAYEFEIEAEPGDRLSFAFMYGLSNDWFFGTPDGGLELFDGSSPVTGDVTDQIGLWDAGTEEDEELAIGAHIGGPEGPADSNSNIRAADYATPVDQHLRVTLSLVQ